VIWKAQVYQINFALTLNLHFLKENSKTINMSTEKQATSFLIADFI
jgi:hypothetical protein